MTVALETVLAKAGLRISPVEFAEMIEEATRRLSPATPDPADYFSAEQRDTLTEVGLDLTPRRPDEVDSRARAVAAQTVLRDSALTVGDAAQAVGVDTSRIRHRLSAGRLAGWKDRGGWRLPAWQFAASGVLPGLDVVLRSVPSDQPPLVVAAFMTTPQSDLRINDEPATPRQWLLAGGDPTKVAALASMLGTPA